MVMTVPEGTPQGGATGKGDTVPAAVVSNIGFKTVKEAFEYPPFKSLILDLWKRQAKDLQKGGYLGEKRSGNDVVSALLEYPKILLESEDFAGKNIIGTFKEVQTLKLPFPKMVVVVGEEYGGGEGLNFFYTFIACQDGDNCVRVILPLSNPKTNALYVMEVPMYYVETPTGVPRIGMFITDEQKSWTTQKQLDLITMYLCEVIYMMTLNPATAQAFVSIPTKDEIDKNKKRVRKDKKPLIEFKLITIDGKKPDPIKAPPAGTHASPKQHWRRGHWRHYASGKTVFIDPMLVGDEKNGKIIKDYAIGLYDDAKNKRVQQGLQ